MNNHPSRAGMNFLHVALMHAGKLFKKPRKFRDHAGGNLVKLPCILENFIKLSCILENLGSFTLRFQKKLCNLVNLRKNDQFSDEKF